MNAASAGNKRPWATGASDETCLALEIILLKRTVVLSWGQFIFAEGSDDEVRLAFSSHDVIRHSRSTLRHERRSAQAARRDRQPLQCPLSRSSLCQGPPAGSESESSRAPNR